MVMLEITTSGPWADYQAFPAAGAFYSNARILKGFCIRAFCRRQKAAGRAGAFFSNVFAKREG
jgi:hypothetical protein